MAETLNDRAHVVKFNVWPDRARKPHYFRVFVFGSRKAMLIFWREQVKIQGLSGEAAAENFRALTQTWTILRCGFVGKGKRRCWVEGHCIGQILTYRQAARSGIVTHEAGHAALHWAESIAKIPAPTLYNPPHGGLVRAGAGEELFCKTLGNLVRQFWINFYAKAPRHWYHRA